MAISNLSNSFDVQLTAAQYVWVGLILGIVQILKDLPLVNRMRAYLPLLVLVLSVGVAVGYGWTHPLPTGLTLGFITLGAYKSANVVVKARQAGDSGIGI